MSGDTESNAANWQDPRKKFAEDLENAHADIMAAAAESLLCSATGSSPGLEGDTEELDPLTELVGVDLTSPHVAPRDWLAGYDEWTTRVHDESVGPHASLTVALADQGALDIPFDDLQSALVICRFAMWRWGQQRRLDYQLRRSG